MPRPADARIAALAGAQGGVVSRQQLADAGLSADGVLHRVGSGRLHRIHPGVYAVGHRAVLAPRPRVGRCAGDRWLAEPPLRGREAGRAHLERSRRGDGAPRPAHTAGVTVHTSRSLHPDDLVLDAESGLPHTSWARTTVDMAELYDVHEMTRYLERSEIERRYDGLTLAAAMTRAHGRHGLKALVPRSTSATTSARRAREASTRSSCCASSARATSARSG